MVQCNFVSWKKAFAIIVLSFCLSALSFIACYADSGGSQGSGGSAGSCQTVNGIKFTKRGSWKKWPSVTCEMTGVGWAYFTYVNGWNKALDFAPSTKGEGGKKTIPAECTKWGGFYHFGYMDEKYGTSPDNDGSGYTVMNGNSKAVLNGYASIGNIARLNGTSVKPSWKSPYWQKDATGTELPPSISHKITVNGTVAAVGDHFEYDGSVKNKYLAWLEVAPSGTKNIWDADGENGISYFCYGSTVDQTTFSSKTEGFVNGSKKSSGSTTTVNSNTANVKFEHTITRDKKGSDSVLEWYEVKGDWPKSGSKTTSFSKGQSRMVYMDYARSVSIQPGQTLTYQQALKYDTSSNGTASSTPVTNPYYVLKIYRPGTGDNAITGQTTARVNDVNKGSGTTTTVSDGKYTISFQHTLIRGNDSAGGTVSSRWSTSTSSSDSSGRKVSPGGTNRSGTQSLSVNQRAYVVPYATETFSGTLLPGETREFCQNLTYEHNINVSGNKTRSAGNFCVKVFRPEISLSACKNDKIGVKSGKNYGGIGLEKVGGYNYDTIPIKSENIINQGEKVVEAWAKEGDKFTFEENMCEGAELPNQYANLGKGITYTLQSFIGGTSNLSLMQNNSFATKNPTTWNNSGIANSSSIGKDIFQKRSSYSYDASNRSPKTSYNSGRHAVASTALGKTIEQRLTWTDLWINNGVVDGTHNGSRTATAVAKIHVPYNYILKPKSAIQGDNYVAPGTNTLVITPSVAVEERINTPVNGSTKYKTATKPTKAQLVTFTIGPDKTSGQVTVTNNGYYSDNSGNLKLGGVCTAFISGGPYNCQSKELDTGAKISGSKSYNASAIAVPDNTPVGAKVCAVTAVWPSDSHNRNGNITDPAWEKSALDGTPESQTNRQWAISPMTCVTVAKKPTLQVRQSGAYAQNSISTAITNKSSGKSFGSWSEYEIISGKPTIGMGSGAVFWNGINFNGSIKHACSASSITVRNDQCGSDQVGNATVSKNAGSSPNMIADNIKKYYTTQSGDGIALSTIDPSGYCALDDQTYKSVGGSGGFTCIQNNGTHYLKVKGNTTTQSGGTAEVYSDSRRGLYSSNATVVHVTGDLTIRKNFAYRNELYKSPGDIPQLIFIAKNINIAPNVTRLDAWLIADESINTCAGVALGVDNCDGQLTITGPVIAKKIAFNRTYGGEGSNLVTMSTGAEVFRLSPATYLWSFAQSERDSQATMTYERELPARY